jgi:hypothetical protein
VGVALPAVVLAGRDFVGFKGGHWGLLLAAAPEFGEKTRF